MILVDKFNQVLEEDEANARYNWWLAALQLKVKQVMMEKMEEEQKKLRAEMDQKEKEKANIH